MTWFKKVTGAALAVIIAAGLMAGCGGSKKEAANEITVGASFELTGNVANYGKSTLNGFKLGIEEINKSGGINGKQIRIVESDNKSEPAEAGNAVTKIITQDRVVAVVGPATSGCVAASEPIATASKIPLIAPCATAPEITVGKDGKVKPFIFRAAFIDPFQGKVMADFALNNLKVKKVAILNDASSDYSKGLAQVFRNEVESRGGTVVLQEAFLAKDIDFKAALTKIKAANPDAIYVPGYYEEVAKIIKQAREMGIKAPLLGSDGWDSPKLVEIAGAAAVNNTFFSNAYSAEDPDPGVQKFIKLYRDKYQKTPDVFALEGYNSALILANAMKKAGTEGPKLAEAIAQTKDLAVPNGTFSYDKDHNPITTALIIEMVNGKQSVREKIGG